MVKSKNVRVEILKNSLLEGFYINLMICGDLLANYHFFPPLCSFNSLHIIFYIMMMKQKKVSFFKKKKKLINNYGLLCLNLRVMVLLSFKGMSF